MNPEFEVKPEESLRQIRTFQGDVANTIGKQKESLVSIQRAEKTRAESSGFPAEESSLDKNTLKIVLVLVTSFFLIAAGAAGGWYAYNEFTKKRAPAVISIPANRLISAARTVDADPATLSRSEIIGITARETEAEMASGEVTHINIPVSTREFFETLETQAPGHLIRAFNPLFMLGILEAEQPSVFVLIRLSSFENAYAGMLSWEKNLIQDIGPLFSTRIALNNVPQGQEFQDVITRNKNARALYGPEGTGVLLIYSFFDNDTLIITDSEKALETLLGRLSSELLSR